MVRSLGLVVSVGLVGLAACSSTIDNPDAPSSAWSLGPAMPRRALEPGVAAYQQRVVVAGGFEVGAAGLEITARVDAFDLADGTWVSLPEAPVRWTSINLASVGVTLYLLGGLEGAERVARPEAFALDALTHTWEPLTAMAAEDARGGAGVVAAPGRIYLLGGASSTVPLDSCLEYEVATGLWMPLPPLPAPRARPAAMRRTDGTLIVAGGFESIDASQPRDDVWALPPPGSKSRVWQPRTPLPPEARGGCAYGVVLGQLVCAGGATAEATSNRVATYDATLDTWTDGEAVPVERTGTQGAGIGGRLFIPGGAATPSSEPADTLYIYAPLDTATR